MENKFGFTSLIIGIFAFIPLIVFFFISSSQPVGEYLVPPGFAVTLIVLITIGIILSALAIVFGIIGAVKDLRKAMAIIGIVLGCGALAFNIIFLIVVVIIPFFIAFLVALSCGAICSGCSQSGG